MAPAAKRAKVAKPEPCCKLLVELHTSLPIGCLEMLASALPRALQANKEGPHKFSSSVLDHVRSEADKEHARRIGEVEEAEADLAAHHKAVSEAAEKLSAAQEEENAKDKLKKSAEEQVEQAKVHTKEVQAAKGQAEAAVPKAVAAVESLKKQKEDFSAKVDENWSKVKEGLFAKKDWRLRQAAIKQVSALLAKTSAPQSLAIALPLALKDAPDTRGVFAQKTVEEGERLLSEFATQMTADIASAEAEVEVAQKAVADAEESVKAATSAQDEAMQASIDAQNSWLEVEEKRSALAKFARDSDAIALSLEVRLENAKSSLEALDEAVKEFTLLQEPAEAEQPTATAAVVSEEAVSMEVSVEATTEVTVEAATVTTA